jgi:transposase InsO family protein
MEKKKGVLPMNTQSTKKKRSSKASHKKRHGGPPYPFEYRLRTVRLFLEEEYPVSLIKSEMGVSGETLYKWAKRYRQYGEEGLKDLSRRPKRSHLSSRVKGKILALKKSNPGFGSRRISDIMRRFFLMRASTATVHQTLSAAQLTSKQNKKPKKNPGKPRFFERSTPNQLWQSDICTFRLGGQNAYLIGFMDDYSRHMTGLGLYRSQTAEHVLEVYRSAIGEYGVPKEMLTDNGRQYTSWRGTTRFEQELKKDRVKHITSRPHHPMTLGKMERFWKTILEEFLFRAQFGSFEEARERIRLWVKYYNHKRPHQGIGGLCPADRFFEIHHELKKTLEQGVEENVLEMALRGKPRDPFYMVGRMGDQSVVIRAEKGKVRMLVDGEEKSVGKELVYDVRKGDSNHENQEESPQVISDARESQSGPLDLDGAALCYGSMPGTGHQLDIAGPVAESGDGRYGEGPGAQGKGAQAGIELPAGEASGEEDEPAQQPGSKAGGAAQEHPAAANPENNLIAEQWYGEEDQDEGDTEDTGPASGRDYHESALWSDDGNPGG